MHTSCCEDGLLAEQERFSTAKDLLWMGSAEKRLPALAPVLCTETDVVEDPPEMIHQTDNNVSVFPGKDMAAEPPKKPELDLTGISATSEDD